MSKFIELDTQYGVVVVNVDNIDSFTISDKNIVPDYPTHISFKNRITKPNTLCFIDEVVAKIEYNDLKAILCKTE